MMVARDMLFGFQPKAEHAGAQKRERTERMLQRERQERRKIRMLKAPRAAFFSTKERGMLSRRKGVLHRHSLVSHWEVTRSTNGARQLPRKPSPVSKNRVVDGLPVARAEP